MKRHPTPNHEIYKNKRSFNRLSRFSLKAPMIKAKSNSFRPSKDMIQNLKRLQNTAADSLQVCYLSCRLWIIVLINPKTSWTLFSLLQLNKKIIQRIISMSIWIQLNEWGSSKAIFYLKTSVTIWAPFWILDWMKESPIKWLILGSAASPISETRYFFIKNRKTNLQLTWATALTLLSPWDKK
jgi:hypothetical protein